MKATNITPGSDILRTLATITTKDHAGRHFTEVFPDAHLDALEKAGLIRVDKPIHEPTGIPYGQEHWTVEVTEEGIEAVEASYDERDYAPED